MSLEDVYFKALDPFNLNKIPSWLTSYFYLGLVMSQPVVDSLRHFWPLGLKIIDRVHRTRTLRTTYTLLSKQLAIVIDLTAWKVLDPVTGDPTQLRIYQHVKLMKWTLRCRIEGAYGLPTITLKTNGTPKSLRLQFNGNSGELEGIIQIGAFLNDASYRLPLTLRFLKIDLRWAVRLFLEFCRS